MKKYELNDFCNGKAFIKDKKTGITYCINKKGVKLFELPPEIKCTTYTEEDVAIIEKDGKFALLDNHGNFLTTFAYNSIDEFTHVVERNGFFGCIDFTTGLSILPCMYDDGMFSFEDGFAVVKSHSRSGAVDIKKNIILPFDYDDLQYAGNNLFTALKDGKYGIISHKNRRVSRFQYDDLFPIKSDDSLFIAQIGEKYGLIDSYGNKVVPIEYEDAKLFAKSNEFVTLGIGGKFCIYSIRRREFLSELVFDDVCYCDDGDYFIVRKDGKNILIDTFGEQVDFPIFYPDDFKKESTLHNTFFEGVRPVSNGSFVGVINKQGKLVVPYIYKSIKFSSEGLMAALDKENREGYIDRKGTTKIPFGKYHNCKDFHCGVARVTTTKREDVYINKIGEIINIK